MSLADIEGEIWKPVPGFEGYYAVSSLGRIKSLQRTRVLHHGGIQPIAAKILRQKCSVVRNKTVNEDLKTLLTSLNLDGVKYCFSVGRLVYHAFIAPIELKDRKILISYKDDDGLNLHFQNLIATNIGELRNKSYENGRFKSPFRKPVSQFDSKGNLIAQYASSYEAGRKNGFNERAIADAASGHSILYKGFVWQQGKSKKLKKSLLSPKPGSIINASLELTKKEQKSIGAVANLSLKSMDGELWKDIPGYEGLYRVSNFGRVKALAKVSVGALKKWYPEVIKKLTPANKKTTPEDSRSTLCVTLSKAHKKKSIFVARYVYLLFVEAFDLKDRSMRIYYKDGNQYNLHYKNLLLKNASWSINKQA